MKVSSVNLLLQTPSLHVIDCIDWTHSYYYSRFSVPCGFNTYLIKKRSIFVLLAHQLTVASFYSKIEHRSHTGWQHFIHRYFLVFSQHKQHFRSELEDIFKTRRIRWCRRNSVITLSIIKPRSSIFGRGVLDSTHVNFDVWNDVALWSLYPIEEVELYIAADRN